MKIVITESYNSDGARGESMEIDGKSALSTYPLYECPEDATLERDMVSCSDIAKLMYSAYQSGVDGDSFSLDTVQEE
jgi:hypothetical protein